MKTHESLPTPAAPVIDAPLLSPEEDAAWGAYQQMRVRLAERLNRELATATGLSEADFEILAFLAERPHTPMRAIALRCGLHWEKSRLSHQLRRMEERGLIQRLACPTDHRSFEVAITAVGREKARAAKVVHAELVARHVFSALDAEQVAAFHAIADAILGTLVDDSAHR